MGLISLQSPQTQDPFLRYIHVRSSRGKDDPRRLARYACVTRVVIKFIPDTSETLHIQYLWSFSHDQLNFHIALLRITRLSMDQGNQAKEIFIRSVFSLPKIHLTVSVSWPFQTKRLVLALFMFGLFVRPFGTPSNAMIRFIQSPPLWPVSTRIPHPQHLRIGSTVKRHRRKSHPKCKKKYVVVLVHGKAKEKQAHGRSN